MDGHCFKLHDNPQLMLKYLPTAMKALSSESETEKHKTTFDWGLADNNIGHNSLRYMNVINLWSNYKWNKNKTIFQ